MNNKRRSFLGKPSIQKQIEIVSALLEQHEDLQSTLKIKKRTLLIQQEIDITTKNGLATKLYDKRSIMDLQQKASDKKLPIIHFLDPSKFDFDALFIAFKELVNIFVEQNINKEGLMKLLNHFESGKIRLSKLVKATLREEIGSIKEAAKESGVETEILLHLTSAIIQPFIEDIARKTDPKFYEKLWQGSCPVCGRIPAVARNRYRKRFLACTYCGTDYLSDNFLCVHCGNKDPYTLKYIDIQSKPAFKIDFCTKCKHYIKVIEETKLKETIPKGMEDILTLNLDFLAKETDLIRN